MGQVSAKLRRSTRGFFHYCPGCEQLHPLPDNGWTFDGNLEAPTFTPSFRQHGRRYDRVDERGIGHGERREWVCHYILTAGQLNFCGDCTHAMAGQSVPLPDLPPEYRDAP